MELNEMVKRYECDELKGKQIYELFRAVRKAAGEAFNMDEAIKCLEYYDTDPNGLLDPAHKYPHWQHQFFVENYANTESSHNVELVNQCKDRFLKDHENEKQHEAVENTKTYNKLKDYIVNECAFEYYQYTQDPQK